MTEELVMNLIVPGVILGLVGIYAVHSIAMELIDRHYKMRSERREKNEDN